MELRKWLTQLIQSVSPHLHTSKYKYNSQATPQIIATEKVLPIKVQVAKEWGEILSDNIPIPILENNEDPFTRESVMEPISGVRPIEVANEGRYNIGTKNPNDWNTISR